MSQYDSSMFWENEDELPHLLSFQYDLMFPLSRIIDGVRMFPYIIDEHGNKTYIGKVVDAE